MSVEDALLTITNEKTAKKIIKHITREKGKDHIWYIYQTIGHLLGEESLSSVIENVKKGKIGWNDSCYDKIKLTIEEHDDFLVKPFDIVEGVTTCLKCKGNRTWNVQKQTRSSDEPMTTFSRCADCGHSWSYSG
jgi:DNA-directed RNA polymerase subunit M/transcription elongation factor TFIIS